MRHFTLLALTRLAKVSRQTARTCVGRGYLETPPYGPNEAIILKVAAACLGFRPTEDPPSHDARIRTALMLARGFLATNGPKPVDCFLLLLPNRVEVITSASELWTALEGEKQEGLVLPIGQWAAAIHR